jgi:hypothetical protein
MRVHLVKNSKSGECEVWVSLEDTDTQDLRTASESFIIASGPDVRTALRAASIAISEAQSHLASIALDGVSTI